jgi:hypothetical protein
MLSRGSRAVAPFLLFAVSTMLAAEDVKVTAGTVEDQRFSDDRFGGLTIELLLKGSGMADVKAVRVRVKSARDDAGTALYKPERDDKPRDFEEYDANRHPGPEVRLSSPSRDASTVDVAGEVELFLPARDPNTKQRFDGFLKGLDKPITSTALKSAKVEITPLSAREYKTRQEKNRPSKEEIIAEGKKHGASDAEIEQALKLMDALGSLSGEAPSENSVLLETKDPEGRIIAIDLVSSDGAEIHAPSRSSSGGRERKTVKIDLSEKPPADAALVVTVRTAKSLVTVPLDLREVALP